MTETAKELYGNVSLSRQPKRRSYGEMNTIDSDSGNELSGNDFLELIMRMINLLTVNLVRMSNSLTEIKLNTYSYYDKNLRFSNE